MPEGRVQKMTDGRWVELLKRTYPSGDYEKRLEGLAIEEIRISRETSVWEVFLRCPFLPAEEEQRQIRSAFCDCFGGNVIYQIQYTQTDDTTVQDDVVALQAAPPTDIATLQSDPSVRHGSLPLPGPDEMEAELNQRLAEKQNGMPGKQKGPALYLGRRISGKTSKLSALLDESKNTIIEVRAFRVNDQRLLKAGTLLYDFDVTDYSGSIKVKIFVDPKNQKRVKQNWLKVGAWYRMKGSARYDTYQKDLVFFPDDVMEATEALRQDRADLKRVELHMHTKLSAMDALISPAELIRQAVAWGHDAVAVTDHGVVQAFPELMDAAAKANANAAGQTRLKVIYGMEGYLIEGDGKAFMKDNKKRRKVSQSAEADAGEEESPDRENEQDGWHIILLAKNRTGIRNLYKLVTLSHLEFFRRRPRIPREALTQLREGLIIGSACEAGELFRLVLAGADETTLEAAAAFYDYLEIQPVMNNGYLVRGGVVADEEGLRDLNRKVLALGRKLGKPVAATGDVHFLLPEDEILRRILQAGQKYKDADIQPPLYYRTTEEMLEEFAYLGEEEARRVVVEATRAIADQVEDLQPIPNKLSTPRLPGAREAIEGMVRRKATQLYGEPLPDWIGQRLEREIRSITDYGYADLYYIAHKLVKFSNDNGYIVGSRGSIGSSLVAYLSDITEVNPLAPHYRCPNESCRLVIRGDESLYDCGADMPDMDCPSCGRRMMKEGFHIPFEVFLGFEGEKIPDIDLNFSGEYQTQAQKYTEELFGREHVFKAGTVFTVADKTAFGFVKNYFKDRGLAVREVETERLAGGLTGVRRTTSQHPGGIVVLPEGDEIVNYTPVQRPADDPDSEFVTTHFDYHAIEKCLVKLDILGHDTPTMIRMLTEMTGKDIREIPLDDPSVLSLFRSPEALGIETGESGIETGALGIPEFGTGFVQGMLLDVKPTTLSELVRISGFSHGTDVWLGNARDVLKNNLGTMKEVIGCREDIMLPLIRAGLNPLHAFKIMEKVRRGGGLSGEDVSAMEEAEVPGWYIDSCNKIKYLFPKAHAAAYVTMAFRIAWFKVFEPLAYYAATFTVREGLDGVIAAGGREKIEETMAEIRVKRERKEASAREEDHYTSLELAREMLLRGYSFLPVSLERSGAGRYLIEDGCLRLPFTALPGLGLMAANSIVEARGEKPFRSVEDLRQRAKIGQTLALLLREQGALGDLPDSDQQLLFTVG